MKKWILNLLQIVIIIFFTLLGQFIVSFFNLNIPESIVGLVLLLISLHMGWIKLDWVEAGSAFLFSEMLLFFIPAIVGIMNYPWLIGTKGILVLLAVIVGTTLAMVTTGIVSKTLLKLKAVKH
ncbi:CidA/LrgA family protein [Rummeliibacillus pycnus]|uniref:CidA/LrgA family protein n=1 Tax=Rummeliibacillus pycnus TaxID=101070 RepID=UPI003D281E69